ncbi:MAG: hypothetical protein GX224_04950 [Thermoplasmatales archaeon]|nr:hypothetical protein [Thermoplasmatales archaeon]
MRCKNCGNEVPENSLNCPNCYREISNRDIGTVSNKTVRHADRILALLLAMVPAAFGFLGMGQFYQGRHSRGLGFLVAGLPLYVCIAFFISMYGTLTVGATFLAFGLTVALGIVYFAIFLIQLADTLAGTLMPL